MPDISEISLHQVCFSNREGIQICDFDQTHYNQNWLSSEDYGPIATVGGGSNRGAIKHEKIPLTWADLFCAAPDMLAALEGLLQYTGGWDETDPEHPIVIARAAVEKARKSQRVGEKIRAAQEADPEYQAAQERVATEVKLMGTEHRISAFGYDLPAEFQDWARRLISEGFAAEHTGGGCMAWSREIEGGTEGEQVHISNEGVTLDGDPAEVFWILGASDADGVYVNCDEAMTLEDALRLHPYLPRCNPDQSASWHISKADLEKRALA